MRADNLLSIDGQPIGVAVVGSTRWPWTTARSRSSPVAPDANGITLGAGTHVVETAGHDPRAPAPTTTGWNIDQLVFDSAAGGGAGPGAYPHRGRHAAAAATQPGPAPRSR